MRQMVEIKPQITYREEGKTSRLLEIIWSFLLLFSFQGGLYKYNCIWTQMEEQGVSLYVGMLILGTLGTVILYHLLKQKAIGYLAAPAMALVFVLIKGFHSLYYGFFGFLNYLISWWNIKYEDGITLVMENEITPEDVWVFVIALSLVITGVFWFFIRKEHLLSLLIFSLAIIITGMVTDTFSAIGCSAFLLGCVGMWMLTIRKRAGWQQLCWFVVIGVLLFGSAFISKEESMQSLVAVKNQIKETTNAVRYGTDTLPQGDLTKANQLLSGEDETLILTTNQKKAMYLRGFVGGRYQNDCWKPLPKSVYKGSNSGMLDWLNGDGFYPQNQYAEYMNNDDKEEIEKNTVKIENTGANRSYIYMPYSANVIHGVGIDRNFDENYESHNLFGKRKYQYDEWSGTRPGELLYADGWVKNPQTENQKKYEEAEAVYADFVYENYLEVDENLAGMIQEIFYDGWESDHTIYSVTERIRDVLDSRAVYREEFELPPEGSDYVSWFLNRGHEGNSVLFATAAVCAFRVQGIPARYVEGYYVTEEQMKQSENGSVVLTNQNSHAWVEVYLDGVGFVPVDVTPGFYYDTYTLLQMVDRPQNISQTAVEQDSDESGNELDREGGTSGDNSDEKERQTKVNVPLTIPFGIVLVLLLLVVITEVRYFIYEFTLEKRFFALSTDAQVRYLSKAVFGLLELYGYKTQLGWEIEDMDDMLAAKIQSVAHGEYRRVTTLMEKVIYGQESLLPGEIRVIYIFAQKLYDNRKYEKVWKRLQIRYLPLHLKRL